MTWPRPADLHSRLCSQCHWPLRALCCFFDDNTFSPIADGVSPSADSGFCLQRTTVFACRRNPIRRHVSTGFRLEAWWCHPSSCFLLFPCALPCLCHELCGYFSACSKQEVSSLLPGSQLLLRGAWFQGELGCALHQFTRANESLVCNTSE